MKHPKSIQNLIDEFTKLPTVGRKTAERFVFSLLKQDKEELKKFSEAILNLKKDIKVCKNCFSVSDQNPCEICADPSRDDTKICVVANTRDLLSIESSKTFDGKYHVLGGLIDTINGIKPDKLYIKQLVNKVKNNNIKEIILALSPTMEGETTSLYLTKILKPYNVKISKLARGLAMGSDIEYADEITIANALKFRNQIKEG